MELNPNMSYHITTAEGAGGIRRQGLTLGESPTKSPGRSRRRRNITMMEALVMIEIQRFLLRGLQYNLKLIV